eukprot:1992635-Rhodomonas_salina.1
MVPLPPPLPPLSAPPPSQLPLGAPPAACATHPGVRIGALARASATAGTRACTDTQRHSPRERERDHAGLSPGTRPLDRRRRSLGRVCGDSGREVLEEAQVHEPCVLLLAALASPQPALLGPRALLRAPRHRLQLLLHPL